MNPVVPTRISKNVKELCRGLNAGEFPPVYLPITTTEAAVPKDCFPNVARYSEHHGGSLVCGWRIWELPRVFLEAEFHGVWLGHDGELLDITPDTSDAKTTLFLRDSKRIYSGKQVNNVRLAIFEHPSVYRFFRACDDLFALMNRGDRAGVHGEVVLEGSDKDEYLQLEVVKFSAMQEIVDNLPSPDRNDPCSCGSGLKYKKCHGLSG